MLKRNAKLIVVISTYLVTTDQSWNDMQNGITSSKCNICYIITLITKNLITTNFQDCLKSDITKLSSAVGTIDANEKKFLSDLHSFTDQVTQQKFNHQLKMP